MMIMEVRGDQWDNQETRVSGMVWVHGVKNLKMRGITIIEEKREIQYNRSQTRVREGKNKKKVKSDWYHNDQG
jgi:hypothetical protein